MIRRPPRSPLFPSPPLSRPEERQHLVQRQLSPPALPAAELLVGGIRDDAIEPGPEGRLAAEGVDLSDHGPERVLEDRKSTRLNSSHSQISYAVFCLKKKNRS